MLSNRADSVLNFIRTYHARHGYAPSRREIGKACKIKSLSNVNGVLTQLADKGKLEIAAGVARGIVLVEEPGEVEWVVANQLARPAE